MEKAVFLVVFFNFHLPVAGGKIQCSEVRCINERVKSGVYSRERICVLVGDRVKLAIVYAEPPGTILFFFTIIIGDDHGLLLGFTTPCFSIFVTSASTTSFSASGSCRNAWCIRGPLVGIECLTVGVLPIGPPVGVNKSPN